MNASTSSSCELVLERERLELGRLDEAALLGALDERLAPVGLEQFGQLVLRQVLCHVLSVLSSRTRTTFAL